MQLSHTAIEVYRRGARFVAPAGLRSAVSLHSHSDCSREKLDFVPRIARSLPLVSALFERSMAEYQRLYGCPLDFSSVYWRPPLAPRAVVESEREQISRRFDRQAFVSLTDHDTFEGPRALRASGMPDMPLSFEWTVPFEGAVFHLGVHAVSPSRVAEAERALAGYTAASNATLGDLLDFLAECPETFVVLNHPYWDLTGIGGLRHDSALLAFLRAFGHRVHALELNGYRTWNENRRVLPLAEGFGIPVVGGGDRHASTPNTILNLTSATCLEEFARELRARCWTYCVVMPEYLEPHAARVMDSAVETLRRTPDQHGGCRRWSDRVFVSTAHGEVSVDAMWTGAPWWLTGVVTLTRLLGSSAVRPLFRFLGADGRELLETDCFAETRVGVTPRLEAPRSAAVV